MSFGATAGVPLESLGHLRGPPVTADGVAEDMSEKTGKDTSLWAILVFHLLIARGDHPELQDTGRRTHLDSGI